MDHTNKKKDINKKILNKKISVKAIDPTLSLVEYKIIKKHALAHQHKTTKNEYLNLNEIKNNKKKLLIRYLFSKNYKKNWFIFYAKLVLILAILCMTLYSLFIAVFVYVEWSVFFQNKFFNTNNINLSFVMNLSPAYFFQYFFNFSGHITIGLPKDLINKMSEQTKDFALNASNYSVSGFGYVSYYRFFNGMSEISANNYLSSNISNELPWNIILQICYSLFGMLLVIIMIFTKSKVHWFSLSILIISSIFIII